MTDAQFCYLLSAIGLAHVTDPIYLRFWGIVALLCGFAFDRGWL